VKYLILSFLLSFGSFAQNIGEPFEEAQKRPTVEHPRIPGSQQSIQEMQTAPTDLPHTHRSKSFHGTLSTDGECIQERKTYPCKDQQTEKKKP
jgi:hypothetical protein